MDELDSVRREEELFSKKLLPDLDLVLEVGGNLNKVGKTLPFVFFNQDVHNIN
jgi:hypothetical protein